MQPSPEIKGPRLDGLIFIVVFGLAALWGWWALENFTEMRVTRRFGLAHEDPISIWIPLIASPALLVGSFWYWSHLWSLVKHGAIVAGRIVSFGASASGMKDVTFSYEYEGEEYQKKESVSSGTVEGKSVGDTVDVVVDTRNPKRAMLNW